jgi:hypothetical protein
MAEKSWLDSLLDSAEAGMDRVEKHADSIENSGNWKAIEIIDEDGSRFWNVSNNDTKKIHVFHSESLAETIAHFMNARAK